MSKYILSTLALIGAASATSSESTEVPTSSVSGKWIVGGEMQSCTQACAETSVFGNAGGYCSNEQLYLHNSDVTFENIEDLTIAGGDEGALEMGFGNGKGTSKAVPNFSDQYLFPTDASKEWPSDFDCCKVPNIGADAQWKKRLCFCVRDKSSNHGCAPPTECPEDSSAAKEPTEFSVCPEDIVNDGVCDATCITQNLKDAVKNDSPLVVGFNNDGSTVEAEEADVDGGSVWYRISKKPSTNSELCYSIKTVSLNSPDVQFALYQGERNTCKGGVPNWNKLEQYQEPVDEIECIQIMKNTWLQVSGEDACGEFAIEAHEYVQA
jgi:hypothetical protein